MIIDKKIVEKLSSTLLFICIEYFKILIWNDTKSRLLHITKHTPYLLTIPKIDLRK